MRCMFMYSVYKHLMFISLWTRYVTYVYVPLFCLPQLMSVLSFTSCVDVSSKFNKTSTSKLHDETFFKPYIRKKEQIFSCRESNHLEPAVMKLTTFYP